MHTTRSELVWIVCIRPELEVKLCTRMTQQHASMSPLTAEAAAGLLPSFSASCVGPMWTKCYRKRHVDTADRLFQSEKDDVCLTIEGTVQMMHMFQQDVETELQGSNGEPVCAAVLYEILGNCVEAVREAAPQHCFMAVTELTPLDDVVTGPALRVNDIWTDSDVWGVLDEGFNATVCGSEWLARATENYATIGYDVLKVSDEGRPFKGLSGMTNTQGSYRIPFALTFEDPKQKLPGVMDTHVFDGKVPLLLSQHAHAALNLVKQMRSSTITVGVNGPKLEVCRAKDSGLLCINLSNALKGLKEKKLPQNLKELRLPGLGNQLPILPWHRMLHRA